MPESDFSGLPKVQKQLSEILAKIVAYQGSLPEDRAVQLNELETRGVLSESDLNFIRSHSVTYTADLLKSDHSSICLSMPARKGGGTMGVSYNVATTVRQIHGEEAKEMTFVYRCIEVARARGTTLDRHVKASDLLSVAAEVAHGLYGIDAPKTLRSIGVHSSATFGKLVYKLIDRGRLSKTDEDRPEDFDVRTSFDDLFD